MLSSSTPQAKPRRLVSALSSTKLRTWKVGILAALTVVLITLLPQLNILGTRGSSWRGSFALIDYDELTYSANLHSLIEGRPRRNNPFLLKNEGFDEKGEDYFSIQFLPSYAILIPSRILKISASTAFILLLPIMAFASSISIFWLLRNVTGNETTAAVGVLVVLLCGRLVSENPLVPMQAYSSFAFLRRYVPAVPFPFFFMFCVFVWRAFTTQTRRSYVWAFLASIVFGVLVFSYFYLWTTAAAWLACITIISFTVRWNDRVHVVRCVLLIATTSAFSVIPYLYLLSLRETTIDETQALIFTRTPDLFRVTEFIGFIILVVLTLNFRRGTINGSSEMVVFTASCALTPFVVFNQQILTGKSLQPFHFEQFIVNYLILVALVCTYDLVWQRLKVRPLIWSLFAIGVGITTAVKESHDNLELNILRDQAQPVFQKLCSLASSSQSRGFVVTNNTLLAASSLTSCSVPELWAPNLYTYGGTTVSEQLERFYQYLYYLGVTPAAFEEELQRSPQTRAAVFGLQRENKALTPDFNPVSQNEIEKQVIAYSSYLNGFTLELALRWPLTYIVMIDDRPYDFSNLDQWYIRDQGQRVGGSIIYPLRLRKESFRQ